MIHTEIVLKGDCGECLGSSLNLDMLFSLNSLMQSVGIAATLHDTSGLLVHNLYLALVDHILHIFLKECVCLQ